jgi:hypothetical protein
MVWAISWKKKPGAEFDAASFSRRRRMGAEAQTGGYFAETFPSGPSHELAFSLVQPFVAYATKGCSPC